MAWRLNARKLLELKQKNKNIENSDYYLPSCMDYIRRQPMPKCPAGKKMVHVSP